MVNSESTTSTWPLRTIVLCRHSARPRGPLSRSAVVVNFVDSLHLFPPEKAYATPRVKIINCGPESMSGAWSASTSTTSALPSTDWVGQVRKIAPAARKKLISTTGAKSFRWLLPQNRGLTLNDIPAHHRVSHSRFVSTPRIPMARTATRWGLALPGLLCATRAGVQR